MSWSSEDDGYAIVGHSWECPKCGHETRFTSPDDDGFVECEQCKHREKTYDPDFPRGVPW